MSPGARAFVAGFAVAAVLAVGAEVYRGAQAALKRVELEAALAARGESLKATRGDLARLRARAESLAVERARLAVSLVGARTARDAARRESASLAERLRAAGDTAGAAVVERGDSAAAAERAACSLVVVNCEARAAAADSARVLAERDLDATAVLLNRTAGRWRDAERRAQPSFFRDVWRARAVTLPLALTTVYLLVVKK